VTQYALRVGIVAVVARRRFDPAGHVVARETVLIAREIVRDLWCQVEEEIDRFTPSLRRVAKSAPARQVVLRWLVAIAADVTWSLLTFGVATCTCGLLVGTLQRNRVIRQPGILEAGRCMAVFAPGSIVGVPRRLVAVSTFGTLGYGPSLVTVQA
jgi:hypothetical protein